MTVKHFFAVALVCSIAAVSCKKKSSATPQETPTLVAANGTLMLHLHTNVDSNEVEDYNTIYTVPNGRKISVSVAQLYISGVQIVKADGSIYDIPNVNILKLQEVEEYMIASVPAGNYKSIHFNIGLSPQTNTQIPAANDSTLNRPNMWFGASAQPSGFVFLNFEGKIDTTTTASATTVQMQSFSYKIGTNLHLKNIVMPDKNYSITSNQTQFIHITIDYNKLFTGIALHNSSNLTINTIADNADVLANQVSNNIPLMFTYEE